MYANTRLSTLLRTHSTVTDFDQTRYFQMQMSKNRILEEWSSQYEATKKISGFNRNRTHDLSLEKYSYHSTRTVTLQAVTSYKQQGLVTVVTVEARTAVCQNHWPAVFCEGANWMSRKMEGDGSVDRYSLTTFFILVICKANETVSTPSRVSTGRTIRS